VGCARGCAAIHRDSRARLKGDAPATSLRAAPLSPKLPPSRPSRRTPRPVPRARTPSTRLLSPAPPALSFAAAEESPPSSPRTASRAPPDCGRRLRRTLETPLPRPRETAHSVDPDGLLGQPARDHHPCLRDLLREHPLHMGGLARAAAAERRACILDAAFGVLRELRQRHHRLADVPLFPPTQSIRRFAPLVAGNLLRLIPLPSPLPSPEARALRCLSCPPWARRATAARPLRRCRAVSFATAVVSARGSGIVTPRSPLFTSTRARPSVRISLAACFSVRLRSNYSAPPPRLRRGPRRGLGLAAHLSPSPPAFVAQTGSRACARTRTLLSLIRSAMARGPYPFAASRRSANASGRRRWSCLPRYHARDHHRA